MSFLGDITGLGSVATAASDAFKAIPDILSKFIPDPNVKAQAEAELQKTIAEGQKAQYDAMAQVMAADSASDSKYTKMARPTVVYWSLGMVTLIALAGLFGQAQPIIDALNGVPPDLYDLIRYGVGIYAAGRSTEKIATTIVKAVTKKASSKLNITSR